VAVNQIISEIMKRTAIDRMFAWKNSAERKPLIVCGARQVGKTWLMKEFAAQAYKKSVYVNFEDNPTVKSLFEQDFDTDRIIASLQLIFKVDIDDDTLLIFDEIQEAPKGVTALKYFHEKAPQRHVVAAGSLLGIAMHSDDSFPVGKVDFMELYPLSFVEYLDGGGDGALANLICGKDYNLIAMMHPQLQQRLREYYYIGGMPEAVMTYITWHDFERVRTVQQNILTAYELDFSKHAPSREVPRIRMVWHSIAAQLVKENKKFLYGMIKEGARAKEFEVAIEWLKDAGLVYKVNRVNKSELPLSAYQDFAAFKMFVLDIGLFGAMHQLDASLLMQGNTLFSEYKGALTEQYVMQQLVSMQGLNVYYWSAENSRGELDFLVQHRSVIHPIEVKAEENLKSKSLRAFVERYPMLHGIRFSMSPYREQDWMTNYPLYLISNPFTS
jgi:hypothetical protein